MTTPSTLEGLSQAPGTWFRFTLGEGSKSLLIYGRLVEAPKNSLTLRIAYPLTGGQGERITSCGKGWFVDLYRRGKAEPLDFPPDIPPTYLDAWEEGSSIPSCGKSTDPWLVGSPCLMKGCKGTLQKGDPS
jgi:hypothetical protein